jgi:hypothetical protein
MFVWLLTLAQSSHIESNHPTLSYPDPPTYLDAETVRRCTYEALYV